VEPASQALLGQGAFCASAALGALVMPPHCAYTPWIAAPRARARVSGPRARPGSAPRVRALACARLLCQYLVESRADAFRPRTLLHARQPSTRHVPRGYSCARPARLAHVRERPHTRQHGQAAARALWPLGGGGGGGGVSTGGGGGVSSGGGGCTAGGGGGATPPGAGTVGRSERDGNCTAPVTMPCAPCPASGAAPAVPSRALIHNLELPSTRTLAYGGSTWGEEVRMVSETRSPNTLVIITLVGRSSVWRALPRLRVWQRWTGMNEVEKNSAGRRGKEKR